VASPADSLFDIKTVQPDEEELEELVYVLVGHPKLVTRKDLERHFCPDEGFRLLKDPKLALRLFFGPEKSRSCVSLVDETFFGEIEGEEGDVAGFTSWSKVLVLGPAIRPEAVVEFLRKGCMGYLNENASSRTIQKAVRAVANGEYWADRKVVTRLAQHLIFVLNSHKLTKREEEIVGLLAQGLKNRQIAKQLSISHETVRWHLRTLYKKLGIQDRDDVVLYARRLVGE